MGGLFRKLYIYICKPIYGLIVYMYKTFYYIATTRFLKDDLIQQFSSNIYVLVSAVMLFAFSITILSAIVNPDLLTDNKKGVSALFKRSIIALALMVLVPFAFNELYDIQESVMSNSLIEKIVVGINYDCNPSTDSNCEIGGNGGQVIAGTLISSVLYPAGDEISVDADIADNYKKMVSEDIRYIGKIAKDINVTVDNDTKLKFHFDDDEYAFHFDGLIAIVAGLAIVYILTIYAIDVAVRVFKLAFLELTAPVSIVAYVGAGDKILSSWFKELGKTYAELFVRIVAIAFYLFLLHNLDTFMEAFTSSDSDLTFILKVFLMVGMLIFVKQVPDMLGRIFGVDIKSKGGIAGRLGDMAGVGNVAKKAWESVRNPLAAAAGVGSLVGGTISHLGAGATGAFQQGKMKAAEIRAAGGKHAALAGALSGTGRALGSILSTPGSAVRSLKSGVKNKNLSSVVGEWDRDRDIHPEGSTFKGRTLDSMRSFVGAKSSADARIAALDKEKVKIDAEIDYNNSIQQISKSIKDAVKNSIEKSNSNISMGLVTQDKNGKMIAYTGNYNQIQERINAERTAAANLTGQARTDEFVRLANVEQQLNTEKDKLATSYLNDVLDSTSTNHAQAMQDLGAATTNTILQQKSEFETRTGSVLASEKVLSDANKEAGKALYVGDPNTNTESLYSQQAKNQSERRERDAKGNFTDYGKKIQDNNARNARNNQGNNSTSSNKK